MGLASLEAVGGCSMHVPSMGISKVFACVNLYAFPFSPSPAHDARPAHDGCLLRPCRLRPGCATPSSMDWLAYRVGLGKHGLAVVVAGQPHLPPGPCKTNHGNNQVCLCPRLLLISTERHSSAHRHFSVIAVSDTWITSVTVPLTCRIPDQPPNGIIGRPVSDSGLQKHHKVCKFDKTLQKTASSSLRS